MSKTIWTKIKKTENKGEEPYFKGVFKALNDEVANGNKIRGIVFKTGEVGFILSDEPDVNPADIVEAPVVEIPKEKLIKSTFLKDHPVAEDEVFSKEFNGYNIKFVKKTIDIPEKAMETFELLKAHLDESEEDILTTAVTAGVVQMSIKLLEEKMGPDKLRENYNEFAKKNGKKHSFDDIKNAFLNTPKQDKEEAKDKVDKILKMSDGKVISYMKDELINDPDVPQEIKDIVMKLSKRIDSNNRLGRSDDKKKGGSVTHDSVLKSLKKRLGLE